MWKLTLLLSIVTGCYETRIALTPATPTAPADRTFHVGVLGITELSAAERLDARCPGGHAPSAVLERVGFWAGLLRGFPFDVRDIRVECPAPPKVAR